MLNREQIKLAAVIFMLTDHIIKIFPVCSGCTYELLDGLSRFTFISMTYFMAEGFFATSSREKYARRLGIFALISQLPYMLAFAGGGSILMTGLNVIFNLFVSFLMLCLLESGRSTFEKAAGVVLVLAVSLCCDCSVLLSGSALLFYIARKKGKSAAPVFIMLCALFFLSKLGSGETPTRTLMSGFAASWGAALAGVAVLCLYNGRRSGKDPRFNKWLFYVFYPAHLLILGLIRLSI